ncbi:hypothetical protein CHS0354_034007, partial [Potamilus streckersoni]
MTKPPKQINSQPKPHLYTMTKLPIQMNTVNPSNILCHDETTNTDEHSQPKPHHYAMTKPPIQMNT